MAINDNADRVRKAIEKMLEQAQNDSSLSEPFIGELKAKGEGFIKPNADDPEHKKTLIGLKTGTFLDSLFLDEQDKSINGIPFGTNAILTGLPNSGKSLLGEEIVLRVAQEHKVVYVLSEEAYRTNSARYDLETRMKVKAKLLNLDWLKIQTNLFILDTIVNCELRDWHSFVQSYRNLVENEKVDFLFIDSMTLLEDSRGALKMRVLELMRYNQLHSITSILINQRGIDEADGLAMAGGVSLSHIVDLVFILDYKKISNWDSQLKLDILDAKQGVTVNFFRILKCRVCKCNARYIAYEIDKDGFIRVKP